MALSDLDGIEKLEKSITESYNQTCADCKSSEVTFASLTFGTYLCKLCGEHHNGLGADVRPIDKDNLKSSIWNEASIDKLLAHGGNDKINDRLEAELPSYYRQPWNSPTCPNFLREAFIRSKYVHEEFSRGAFAKGSQVNFACSTKSGLLLKKLRDSETFCERFFELNVERNMFKYFIKPSDEDPKETLDLERMNITFVDSKTFDLPPHTALVQFVQNGSTRHIFLRSEDSRTIINWYNSIRLGKYHRLCLGLMSMGLDVSGQTVASQLTRDVDVCGWLEKTGPSKNYAWRRRWCMLIQRHFLYTEKPLSPFAKGEIFIESHENGFSVRSEAPQNWKKYKGHAFTIVTPSRPFVFVCETKHEQQAWISALTNVMCKPMTTDDKKRAASVFHKHND